MAAPPDDAAGLTVGGTDHAAIGLALDRVSTHLTRRAIAEARLDAERLLLATQTALEADGDLLDASERAAVDAAMAAVREIVQMQDAAVIEAASKALADRTENFAAMRMNRGIQQALAGKNIETV